MPRRSQARITVLNPGWLTTVQDRGRYGYQKFGVATSGAMDWYAFTVANRLVGNRDEDAVLELTLKGPELRFDRRASFALTGADLTPTLDGRRLPLWTSLVATPGSRLAFGARCDGARCYLAIAGGIDVPIDVGSRATHLLSHFGGLSGRALAKGDIIEGGPVAEASQRSATRYLPKRLRTQVSNPMTLHVLPGPQLGTFASQAWERLTSVPYRLSSQSDRMGYRLVGPWLDCPPAGSWVSDGTVKGAVQVPPDGQPILLMSDCQTTGGYPKVAVVITADLPLAGQLAPGDALIFQPTTPADARAMLRAQWSALDAALPGVL